MNTSRPSGQASARLRLLAAVLIASVCAPAIAGVFSVTPVRIFMNPRDRAVAVTVVNEGDTPVVLQADINRWTQKPDAADELVLTEDLVLSPPILRLGPKARQVVRLAMLRPADASRQLTYRLVLREIPEAAAPAGNVIEVPIALALSMPVFITPPSARREVDCRLQPPGASLAITCANTGSAYAQIREVQLLRSGSVAASFEGGAYILPGASRAITLKPAAGPVAPGAGELKVTYDDGRSQNFGVTLP